MTASPGDPCEFMPAFSVWIPDPGTPGKALCGALTAMIRCRDSSWNEVRGISFTA
jgi:hypothetical protein